METTKTPEQALLDAWAPGEERAAGAFGRMLGVALEAYDLSEISLYRRVGESALMLEAHQRRERDYGDGEGTKRPWWRRLIEGREGRASMSANNLGAASVQKEAAADPLGTPREEGPVARMADAPQWRELGAHRIGFALSWIVPLWLGDSYLGVLLARGDVRSKACEGTADAGPWFAAAMATETSIEVRDRQLSQHRHTQTVHQTFVSTVLSTDHLLETMLLQSTRALYYEAGALFDVDEALVLGHVRAGVGWEMDEVLANVSMEALGQCVALEEFAGQVVAMPDEIAIRALLDASSVVALPIIDADERCLAVMILVSRHRGQDPSTAELVILERFATMLGLVRARHDEQARFERDYLDVLEMMAATLDLESPARRGHHERVRALAGALGQALELGEQELADLDLAARVHDIGRLHVEGGVDGVLREFEHPELGANMLAVLPGGARVAQIIREHHETHDGFGFPSQLSGDALCLEGQVLAWAEWVVERTTTSPTGAESLRQAAAASRREARHRFETNLARAGADLLEQRVDIPHTAGRCARARACPEEVAAACAARTSEEPCWTIEAHRRQCELHGNPSCEGCFVYLTWANDKETA